MNKSMLLRSLFVSLFLSVLVFQQNAFAYLDPGTGSYILQLALAFLFGALFTIKVFWNKIRMFLTQLFSKK